MARTIAILGGTGPEGFGLASRWARAGETVIIGSRDARRAKDAAEKIVAAVPNAKVSGDENLGACSAADMLVLTVPFEGHAALLKQIKSAIRPGTIVVDTTVPLAASVGGPNTRTIGVRQGSAAQETAELVPKEIPVVAAFHNASAELPRCGRSGRLRRNRMQRRSRCNSGSANLGRKNSRCAADRWRQTGECAHRRIDYRAPDRPQH